MSAIAGDIAVFTLKPLNTEVFSDQSIKGTPLATDQSAKQTMQASTVDANLINKVFPVKKQTQESRVEAQKPPVRTMNHVVDVYNLQGKMRTKFMDSNNDVIYQIPTEMVAKLEDQMLNPNTSTSTKG